jgi:threonine/homoserine/homoserine lactone efflux protein
MELVAIYLGIMGALLAGAISPGPSFILVCRTAMVQSRKAGLAAAFGMGVGGAIFALLALLGLTALLIAVPALYLALKIGGGLYLLYLAWRIWRGARETMTVRIGPDIQVLSVTKAFWLALGTQISNPKTAIVYGSIFTAFLPASPPPGFILALVPGVFFVEFGWYAIVAVFFSFKKPREAYLSAKFIIDRAVALILGALGGRLLFEGAIIQTGGVSSGG